MMLKFRVWTSTTAAILVVACGATPEAQLRVSFSPDEVTLLPKDYRNQPAVGQFGIVNQEDVTIYVSTRGFKGEHAEVLSGREGADIPVAPQETLWIPVSYQPTPALWADGSFDATLELEVGRFTVLNDDFHGNVATYRDAHAALWFSKSMSLPIHFTWNCDVDADGFVADACGGDDCNDARTDVHLGVVERCDGVDNDCNQLIDDNAPDASTFYADADADGHGAIAGATKAACTLPATGWARNPDDCDDNDDTTFPGQTELCGDDADNNCNNTVNEGCPTEDTGDTDLVDTGDGPGDDSDVDTDTDIPPSNVDTDNDGLTDVEEAALGTNPRVRDTDSDGIRDGDEVKVYHTDPLIADTDEDGVADGVEVFNLHSDPLVADTDADTLSDGDEYYIWHTNLLRADTDSDGLSDAEEVLVTLTDPTRADTDNDGLSDAMEYNVVGSNPNVRDTDSDTLSDGDEVNLYHTSPLLTDTDHDTLDDAFELFTLHTSPLLDDTDNDGLFDAREHFITHTPPNDPDADDDGLNDGAEVDVWFTNPLVADTDLDGLSDGAEVNVHHTDPLIADTDDDGLSDGDEVNEYHTNPLIADPDNDGLSDGDEILYWGTDPADPDSDADGLTDGAEVLVWLTNPLLDDTDDDTLFDGEEALQLHTDPTLADTDADGLRDDEELYVHLTDPLLADTDEDGLDDGAEIYDWFTDPLDDDSDDDGVSDGDEVLIWHSDPWDPDTDGDGLQDGIEVNELGSDPTLIDSDLDRLSDADEVQVWHTDPARADTDGDGFNDGDEVAYSQDPLVEDTAVVLNKTNLAAGQIVITEIMVQPAACAEDQGEYFEIENVSGSWVNIAGLRFDTVTNFAVNLAIADQADTLLYPGERALVVRRSATPCVEGWRGDYRYETARLANTGDRVRLRADSATLDEVDFSSWSIPAGASLSLDPTNVDATLNNAPGAWCAASTLIPHSTDFGTPGEANDSCP